MSIIGSKSLASESAESDIEPDAVASAAFESAFRFEAIGDVKKSLRAIFASSFQFIAIDVFEFAEFVGSFDFIANGFLNAEPNITDEVIFASEFLFEATDSVSSEALAVFGSHFEFEAIPHFAPAQEYRVSVNLTILPGAQTNNNIRVWQPRLLVDGEEVQIISWNAPEGESNVGRKLTVVLQRWTDKNLFTDTAVVNFGIGKKVAGVWDAASFKTLIDGGTFQVSSHTVSGQPQNAEDRVTITLTGRLGTRLNTRPENAIVVYDPSKIVQRTDFYQTQRDQFGHIYTTELSPVFGLSLQSLMAFAFGECGLSVVTNLPDYPIVQNYFALGERFYDGVKKFIGIFNPIIYSDGDTIGIMDATLLQPGGFPDAEIIEVDRVTNLSVSDDRTGRQVSAIRIQFIHNIEDFDVITTRIDEPFETPEGDNVITTMRTWRVYTKNPTPFINAREELISEIREKRDSGNVLLERSTELFTFGASGDVATRKQTIEGLYPDLENWIGKPETEPPYLFGETARETETFEYKSFPIDSLDGSDQRTYISDRGIRRTGMIIVNASDKHLGQPFRQEIQVGTRSGNVTEDATIESNVLIKTIVETGEPMTGGLVNYTTLATDYLPPKPTPYVNYSQRRPGDIAARQYVTNQQALIIRSPGAEPIDGIEDFNFGPLPLSEAIPLAERFIAASSQSPRTVEAQYIGYDDSLAPGQVRRLALRDGTILGSFMILGRTAFGSAGGTFMTLVCREV